MRLQAYQAEVPIIDQYVQATVVGLGVTGYSVVRYLRARGFAVQVVDSRAKPPMAEQLANNYPEVSLFAGQLQDAGLADSALIIASPGVPLSEPNLLEAKRNGSHIVGDIELFVQENRQPLIAITGSNGKSTVTSLVGDLCRAGGLQTLVAGNIGLPALDALTDQVAYQVAVLELSSFQLETTANVHADTAAILNVSADHMDRYDSMGAYLLSKARILRGAKRIVLPKHDMQLQQLTYSGELLSFDLDEPLSDSEFGIKRQSNHRWLLKGQQRLIKLRDIPLIGLHNVKNVLAAFALVDFLNLAKESSAEAVKAFVGLPHRMQVVATHNGVTWVNDSKATNVGATSTAIANLESDIVWIAGGQSKGADFNDLKDVVNSRIKSLILFGEDADQIAAALNGLVPIAKVENMHQAVVQAGSIATSSVANKAANDSVVLFSPACASFDMYKNYEQRGDDFSHCVQTLLEAS